MVIRRFPGIGDLVEDLESQSLRKARKGIEPRNGISVQVDMRMGKKIKRMNNKEKIVRWKIMPEGENLFEAGKKDGSKALMSYKETSSNIKKAVKGNAALVKEAVGK